MDHDAFVDAVMQAAGIDHDEAERAVRATLTTLAERISAGEARDLAAQLPPELAPWLNVDKRSERFDVDEFLRRVAERSGADGDAALRRARSVFAVLGQAIAASELDDVVSELPKNYGPLLPRRARPRPGARARRLHDAARGRRRRRVLRRDGAAAAGLRQCADPGADVTPRPGAL